MACSTKISEQLCTALKEEQAADIDETNKLLTSLSPKQLANRGLAIINLVIGSIRTGTSGRPVISLELDPAVTQKNQELDFGEIRNGDIVRVSPYLNSADTKKKTLIKKKTKQLDTSDSKNDGSIIEGVVSMNSNSLNVVIEEAFSNAIPSSDTRLWIVKLTNNATYKRMEYALKLLKEIESPSRVQSILLGNINPSKPVSLPDIQFFDSALNGPQKEAIKFSLSESEVAVIHGPPGTGKTYTLVEIIRQFVSQGKRVLVCGPSNISVDNILERLHNHIKGNKLIRIGHPARLLENNRIHSLDIVSKSNDYGQVVRELREEIDETLKKISKTRSGRERKEIYNNIKDLRKDYREREKKVIIDIILESQVVISTLHGAGSYSLRQVRRALDSSNKHLFDVIIIDEVSQSLEAQCWIPIMDFPGVTKLIIAGDNKQLPPVVMSKNLQIKSVLEQTLFDRLEKLPSGNHIIKLLSIQYRMNKLIMEFPSNFFYKSKLIADESVAEKVIHLDKGEDIPPILWLDTQGYDYPEANSDESLAKGSRFEFSKYNENEAYLTRNYVFSLVKKGVKPTEIGIIAPYSAQISLLSKIIHIRHREIEISTVDGFQGREKIAIVLSLVRSNDTGEVGFLAEERRLNVAITRPKRHLCIIGNTETLTKGNSKFLKQWVKWSYNKSEIDYPPIEDVLSSDLYM